MNEFWILILKKKNDAYDRYVVLININVYKYVYIC